MLASITGNPLNEPDEEEVVAVELIEDEAGIEADDLAVLKLPEVVDAEIGVPGPEALPFAPPAPGFLFFVLGAVFPPPPPTGAEIEAPLIVAPLPLPLPPAPSSAFRFFDADVGVELPTPGLPLLLPPPGEIGFGLPARLPPLPASGLVALLFPFPPEVDVVFILGMEGAFGDVALFATIE